MRTGKRWPSSRRGPARRRGPKMEKPDTTVATLLLPAPVPSLYGAPIASYLARLAPGSRPAQATACGTVGRIIGEIRGRAPDLDGYALTAACRAELVARYQPATVNR